MKELSNQSWFFFNWITFKTPAGFRRQEDVSMRSTGSFFFVFIFHCVPRHRLSAGWMWREITAEITLTTTTPNISAELQAASQPIARLSLIFTQCHDLRLRTENSCEHDSYLLSLSFSPCSSVSLFSRSVEHHISSSLHFLSPLVSTLVCL